MKLLSIHKYVSSNTSAALVFNQINFWTFFLQVWPTCVKRVVLLVHVNIMGSVWRDGGTTSSHVIAIKLTLLEIDVRLVSLTFDFIHVLWVTGQGFYPCLVGYRTRIFVTSYMLDLVCLQPKKNYYKSIIPYNNFHEH